MVELEGERNRAGDKIKRQTVEKVETKSLEEFLNCLANMESRSCRESSTI